MKCGDKRVTRRGDGQPLLLEFSFGRDITVELTLVKSCNKFSYLHHLTIPRSLRHRAIAGHQKCLLRRTGARTYRNRQVDRIDSALPIQI